MPKRKIVDTSTKKEKRAKNPKMNKMTPKKKKKEEFVDKNEQDEKELMLTWKNFANKTFPEKYENILKSKTAENYHRCPICLKEIDNVCKCSRSDKFCGACKLSWFRCKTHGTQFFLRDESDYGKHRNCTKCEQRIEDLKKLCNHEMDRKNHANWRYCPHCSERIE